MNTTFITYFLYLVISIAMTIWVARTLHKNGRVFLVEAFHDREALADSINHLLVVGFYLVNLGFISLHLASDVEVNTATAAIELLSKKVGVVMLILGGMHFFNILVFNRWRRKERNAQTPNAQLYHPYYAGAYAPAAQGYNQAAYWQANQAAQAAAAPANAAPVTPADPGAHGPERGS